MKSLEDVRKLRSVTKRLLRDGYLSLKEACNKLEEITLSNSSNDNNHSKRNNDIKSTMDNWNCYCKKTNGNDTRSSHPVRFDPCTCDGQNMSGAMASRNHNNRNSYQSAYIRNNSQQVSKSFNFNPKNIQAESTPYHNMRYTGKIETKPKPLRIDTNLKKPTAPPPTGINNKPPKLLVSNARYNLKHEAKLCPNSPFRRCYCNNEKDTPVPITNESLKYSKQREYSEERQSSYNHSTTGNYNDDHLDQHLSARTSLINNYSSDYDSDQSDDSETPCVNCRCYAGDRKKHNIKHTRDPSYTESTKAERGDIADIRDFRDKYYFECHSSQTMIDQVGGVLNDTNHKCKSVYKLNKRDLPEPIYHDHHGVARCPHCHLPLSYNRTVKPSREARARERCRDYQNNGNRNARHKSADSARQDRQESSVGMASKYNNCECKSSSDDYPEVFLRFPIPECKKDSYHANKNCKCTCTNKTCPHKPMSIDMRFRNNKKLSATSLDSVALKYQR